MAVAYVTHGHSFLPDKQVVWSQFQVEAPVATPEFTARGSVDPAPDGKRFAVLVPANTGAPKPPTHINVLFNFFGELQRKTAKGQ